MDEPFEFPTQLHSIANKHYNTYPDTTVENVSFILDRIDENKLQFLRRAYFKANQFTRVCKIEEQWNELYADPEDQLSGLQIDILLYLLNMYGCKIAKMKRNQKFKRGMV